MSAAERDDFRQLVEGEITSQEYVDRLAARVRAQREANGPIKCGVMPDSHTLYIVRCEDCGAMQAVTREGGQLLECCAADGQRSFSMTTAVRAGAPWTPHIQHGRVLAR